MLGNVEPKFLEQLDSPEHKFHRTLSLGAPENLKIRDLNPRLNLYKNSLYSVITRFMTGLCFSESTPSIMFGIFNSGKTIPTNPYSSV